MEPSILTPLDQFQQRAREALEPIGTVEKDGYFYGGYFHIGDGVDNCSGTDAEEERKLYEQMMAKVKAAAVELVIAELEEIMPNAFSENATAGEDIGQYIEDRIAAHRRQLSQGEVE